jgi:hypothetical protein
MHWDNGEKWLTDWNTNFSKTAVRTERVNGVSQNADRVQISKIISSMFRSGVQVKTDRLCGLVVRVLGYRSGGPGSIPGTTRKKVVDLERGPLSLMNTTEELLDRKIAAPV